MTSSLPKQLAQFKGAFQRGIGGEMTAMRARLGAFEIPITSPCREPERPEQHAHTSFSLAAANEKLVVGVECSLRVGVTEQVARVVAMEGLRITVSTSKPIDETSSTASLVIYPWFLYERLLAALGSLNPEEFCVDRAMALFGKGQVHSLPTPFVRNHDGLNRGQRAAVQLCSDTSLAFVWGPPGTGKTTTLAHIVDELCAQGKRVLLVSTTNAALDHVLAQLAENKSFRESIDSGLVVRLGESEAETYGTSVDEVVHRTFATRRVELTRLRERLRESSDQMQRADRVLAQLSAAVSPQQSLFETPPRVNRQNLLSLFPDRVAQVVASLPPAQMALRVSGRRARFEARYSLCKQRITEHERAFRNERAGAVTRSRCVFATLANAYLSPLMKDQRFDVVIAEEASMAVLPTLFYAACLAKDKTIMVGDPRQLPPIVQSEDAFDQHVLGRTIFEVTVPEPESSPRVAMLDTQYRMHPVIGELVSGLSYGGRLIHGDNTAERESIARLEPFPGAPLVVVDTRGHTRCDSPAGSPSRRNAQTAQICAQLALDAVRAGAESVGVITPYALQAREIRSRLGTRPNVRHIQCSTIHRFQGQEKDVIVVDMVDAAPMRPGMLLSDRATGSSARNLLNVSLSRARGKLILVADVEYFQRNAPASVVTEALHAALQSGHHVHHTPK